MDGNLQQAIPSSPPDRVTVQRCGRRQIGTSSEMSGLTEHNSRDLVEHDQIAIPGLWVAESMSTQWTDEKHSLYLNSKEALFVKQLHNYKYRSMDLLCWRSRIENLLEPNSSRQANADNHISSNQFKLLRSWQKINFERARPHLDIVDESRVLLENQWNRHFKSASKCREVTTPDLQENGVQSIGAIHSVGQKAPICGVATSSKKLPACHPRPRHQDSVNSNTEVSDQNFVDEDHGGEHLSSLCRTKRMKIVSADVSIKDQVVPMVKYPVTVDPNENSDSLEKEDEVHSDRQSENMDGCASPESRSPVFVDQELNGDCDDSS